MIKQLICVGALGLLLQGCGGSDSGGETVSYLVSATAGDGGTISPASKSVVSGQSSSFAVQPAGGFQIASVSGCAGQLSGKSYTTGRITADCTVTASFERASYQINTTVSGEGSITPDSLVLRSDEQGSFELMAGTGYEVASVTGCDGSLDGTTYRLGPLTERCDVTVNFEPIMFDVLASAGSGGSVTPVSQLVQYGQQAQVTLTADEGFRVANVEGCPGELNDNVYTTAPITSVCPITASFEPNTYTITTLATAGGSIVPEQVTAPAGTRQVFTLNANDGFNVGKIEGCDGVFDGEHFIIPAVVSECQLSVQFNSAEFVYFSDPNLAKVVRKSLGLTEDAPIPGADLASLSVLYAGQANIERLDGLQYATGLKALHLQQNELSDISLLLVLARNQPAGQGLRSLRLDWNDMLQLPEMSELADLHILSLTHSKISDISAISGLLNLRSVDLSGNDITDISALSQLPISTLTLSYNPIDSAALWSLQSLPLQNLYLAGTDIDSLEGLASITSLRHLVIHTTAVEDLSVLRQLPNLEWLESYRTRVVNLTPLLDSYLSSGNFLSLGGCLKLTGFSRAQPVIDELQARGVSVVVYNWAEPGTPCPEEDGIESLNVNANLTAGGLALQWQVVASDQGPWRCELHLDIEQQQARAPVAVLDDCHLTQSWQLPDIKLDKTRPYFVLDTGLVTTKLGVEVGEVQNEQRQADIQFAGHDWLQAMVKSNPYLVPARESVLRLHLLSDSQAAVPQVAVRAERAGLSTDLLVEPPASLPTARKHEQLTASYRINVPASVMQAGLRLHVTIPGLDPMVIEPEFAAVNVIDLTLVPLQLGEIVTTLPDDEVVKRSLMKTWPLANVNISRRQPFQLAESASTNTTSSMITEVNDLRMAEGAQSYYYGYFTSSINTDRFGGRGYRPGYTSVGVLPSGEWDSTLSHELGHNFGIQHAPCGSAEGADAAFPYTDGNIGSWGVPLSFNELLSPSIYNDVMGYCGNRHVSDYNFEKAQDYLLQNITHPAIYLQTASENNPVNTGVSQATKDDNNTVQQEPVWYYRMALSAADQPDLRQMMQLAVRPQINANSGYQIVALYDLQAPLLLPVELLRHGHGNDAPELSFVIPLHYEGKPLLRWELYQANTLRYQSAPVVPANVAGPDMAAQSAVLIEERSGEVCVNAGTTPFDRIHLMWLDGNTRQVIALNETKPVFCRTTVSSSAGGIWQVQLRTGDKLQVIEQPR